jgi:hypothetical protein
MMGTLADLGQDELTLLNIFGPFGRDGRAIN